MREAVPLACVYFATMMRADETSYEKQKQTIYAMVQLERLTDKQTDKWMETMIYCFTLCIRFNTFPYILLYIVISLCQYIV